MSTTPPRTDPLWALIPALSAHRGALIWTGLVGLANNLALVFLAVAGSYTVTLALVEHRPAEPGWWIAAASAVLLRAVLTWHEMDISHSIAYRVLAALRMALFDGFARGVPSRSPDQHTGRLAATAMGETEKLEFFYAHTLTQLAGAAVLLIGALLALGGLGPTLAAGFALGCAALVAFSVPLLRKNARLGERIQRAKSDQSALVVDVLSGTREILSFDLRDRVGEQLSVSTRRIVELERRLRVRESAAASIRELCTLAILIVVFVLAWNQPGLERVWIPAVIAGTLTVLAPLTEAVAVLTQLQPHRASAATVVAGISLPPEGPTEGPTVESLEQPAEDPGTRTAPRGPSMRMPAGPLGLELNAVQFSYAPDAPALAPTWLTIAAGEHIGIAGRSGSGKTTLARLLARLWEPDRGSIHLTAETGAHYDLRDLDLSGYRSHVGLVEQDATIFHGSLWDNLRLADPTLTEDTALHTLTRAGLTLDPGRWPAGVHTELGEAGSGISGGERARIALARALVRRPRILILDETTAALDARSESSLLDALAALRGETTVITISHRPSTLARCDRVVQLPALHREPEPRG
ncbi:ABC transporter ATP-binding protein [Mycetocola saprophilus]|uniref:ABC transporter ATP-binding protein n=1 Tax=Mycetocola saprophilus TaxID=76636 RepID=UPI0005B76763|nr:ABC transporter ATP-binding protein [Mycetocola saprophilus]